MKIKSLGLKVSLLVALMITVIVVATIVIVSTQSSALILEVTGNEAAGANNSFSKQMDGYIKDAATTARIIAYSNRVMDAVTSGDEAGLKAALLDYGSDIDTVMVADLNGDVILRKHNDQKGDNVMGQSIVSETLRTGVGIGTIAKGSTVGLSTRGSSVIKDFNGDVIGVVVCGHDLSNPKYMDEVKSYTGSEVTIFDWDERLMTTIVDSNNNRVVGTKVTDPVILDTVLNKKESYHQPITLFEKEYYAHYSPLIVDGTVYGMLFTGVNIDSALAGQRNMVLIVSIVGIVCGLLCIALIQLFNVKSVNKPLAALSSFFRKASTTGDITTTPEEEALLDHYKSRADEIGRLMTDSVAFIDHIIDAAKELEDVAGGDLSFEVELLSNADTIGISLKNMVDNLNVIFGEIRSSSAQVSNGSKQVAGGAQSLAQGSTEQAASIEELSSSIAEIAERTKENSSTANRTSRLSESIKENAEKGSRQMDDMIAAVGEINEASKNISKIIKTIDDIAFQTNILALNAAVEAARAGQHGKGFAVVAEEVRNLASKSAQAAKETGDMIQNSMDKAELGSRIASETAESLSGIVTGISESNQLVAEIAKGSEEQSLGIEQINVGIDQVAQVVQQNSATAEESAAASEEMSSQSDMLQQLITQFKLKNEGMMHQSLPPTAAGPAQSRLAGAKNTQYAPKDKIGEFGKY